MALKLQNMYIRLGFSPEAAKLLVREQGLVNPDGLRVLTNKNVDDICDVMRIQEARIPMGLPIEGSKSQ